MGLRNCHVRAHFPGSKLMAGPPPEDTVFYKLFPVKGGAGEAGETPDLTCLAVRCSQVARELARGHIWHYQPFELEVCRHVTGGMLGMCLFISPKGLVTRGKA